MSTAGGSTATCPECGKPVDPSTQQLCPFCSYPLMFAAPVPPEASRPVTREPGKPDEPYARPAPPPPADQTDDPTLQLCPSCGHRSRANRVRCEQCGAALGVVAVLLDLPPGLPAPQPRLARDRWPLLMTGLAVLAVVFGVVWFLTRPDTIANLTRPRAVKLQTVPHREITVSASSRLGSTGSLTYFACNVLDGSPQTAWNSDKDRQLGSSLVFKFDRQVDVQAITVVNGYAKNAEVFSLNSSVARATVSTQTTSKSWDLADDPAAQTLTADLGPTTGLTFRIDVVRPGAKYAEVAISEVTFKEKRGSPAGSVQPVDVSCPPAS